MTALRDVSIEQFEARESEMPPVVARRCRFIIEENQRVLDLAPFCHPGIETLQDLFSALLTRGARDLFEIGAPSMEAMMEAMRRWSGGRGRQAGGSRVWRLHGGHR